MLNPAAWTHYSYALRDACAAAHRAAGRGAPEQPQAREEFRHTSVISAVASGVIAGFGDRLLPAGAGARSRVRAPVARTLLRELCRCDPVPLSLPRLARCRTRPHTTPRTPTRTPRSERRTAPRRTMATTNDLKNGMVLNIDGQLWTVVEFQHVKPGKGPAFVRTKLKNVLSGKVVDKTFNAGLKVETANVDKRDMQYLVQGRRRLRLHGHSSPTTSCTSVPARRRRGANYLLENQDAIVATHDGLPLYVELPASVELVDHLHRARPAGRPLHRRHQARHAGDRCGDPGPAVRRAGREDQGRHPRRVLPRPREADR